VNISMLPLVVMLVGGMLGAAFIAYLVTRG